MATEILVPELGESVIEATVGEWLKQVGDEVAVGEVIVELETDKVDVEVGATTAGFLAEIRHSQGSDVSIGDVLGLIDSNGASAQTGKASTVEQPDAAENGGSPTMPAGTSPKPAADGAGSERATPVARRAAVAEGVDLTQVTGTGPGGRVTKQDVVTHRAEPASQPDTPPQKPPAPASAPTPVLSGQPSGRPEERIRMSRRRRTIANRLVEVQQEAAILTTFNEIDMTAVMDVRKRRQEAFVERHGIKLGFTSFFVKASVGALKAFPRLNAEIDGDDMVLKHYYDVGIAVGAEEGLVVPVIRDADRQSFADIEQQVRDFAARSSAGELTLDDLRGGTFTITNGGVFGSMLSTPILNPPQVGILGLHNIQQRPVVVDGEIVIRPIMYVALSYDHRIVDGREAVQFLVMVKQLIEDPEVLLLEG